MKVRSAIKLMCKHCFYVKKGKKRYVYCKESPKHKQRQGFHTLLTNNDQIKSNQSYEYICNCSLHSQSSNLSVTNEISIDSLVDLVDNKLSIKSESGNHKNEAIFKYTSLGFAPLFTKFE